MGVTIPRNPRIEPDSLAPIWAMGGQGPTFAGDAGDVADACGRLPALVRSGACTWGVGPSGPALSYTGSSNSVGPIDVPVPGPSPFWVSARFRSTASGIQEIIRSDAGSDIVILRLEGGSLAGYLISGSEDNVSAAGTYNDGREHAADLVATASTVTLYADGVAVASVSRASGPINSFTPYIGSLVGSNEFFAGQISHVFYWLRAPSAAEVAANAADPNRYYARPRRTRRRYQAAASAAAYLSRRSQSTGRIGSRGFA